MRTALFLLAFLAVPALAGQTVWKWVDDQGVTHYSDRPVPGATRIDIAVSSRSESSDASAASSAFSAPANEQEPAGPAYRDFEIWKPADDESIVNTGGQVAVNVRIQPGLRAGHSLHLYLDGRLVEGSAPNAASYDLQEVPRGTHRVIAVINDQRGARVQETAPVTFHVRQESIANPPVGPALRPPPKPRPGRTANKLPAQQPSYAALNGARAQIDPATNLPVRKKPATKKPAPKNPGPTKKGD